MDVHVTKRPVILWWVLRLLAISRGGIKREQALIRGMRILAIPKVRRSTRPWPARAYLKRNSGIPFDPIIEAIGESE